MTIHERFRRLQCLFFPRIEAPRGFNALRAHEILRGGCPGQELFRFRLILSEQKPQVFVRQVARIRKFPFDQRVGVATGGGAVPRTKCIRNGPDGILKLHEVADHVLS